MPPKAATRSSPQTVARIRFIRSAIGLGFKLNDVAELRHISKQGTLACPRARALLADRIDRNKREVEPEFHRRRGKDFVSDAGFQGPQGVQMNRRLHLNKVFLSMIGNLSHLPPMQNEQII